MAAAFCVVAERAPMKMELRAMTQRTLGKKVALTVSTTERLHRSHLKGTEKRPKSFLLVRYPYRAWSRRGRTSPGRRGKTALPAVYLC